MAPTMIFSLLLLIVSLLLALEAIRRAGAWLSWLIFALLPVVLLPWWIAENDFDLFAWMKLYTVLGTAFWLTLLRFTRLIDYSWARFGFMAWFAVNILEAVVYDLCTFQLASLLNGVAGLLLLTGLPQSSDQLVRDQDGSNLSVSGLDRRWIVAFTTWNLAFLYINFAVIFGHHVTVLGVMLAIGLRCPTDWLQVRINLLAIDLMALATFRRWLIPAIDTTTLSNSNFELIAGSASLLVVFLLGRTRLPFFGLATKRSLRVS